VTNENDCILSPPPLIEVGNPDLKLDEALGLNCAWYADILLTLTEC
jgi:hypothetical protein